MCTFWWKHQTFFNSSRCQKINFFEGEPFLIHLLGAVRGQWTFWFNPNWTCLFWTPCDWGSAPKALIARKFDTRLRNYANKETQMLLSVQIAYFIILFLFMQIIFINMIFFLLIIKSIKRISICKKFLKNLMDTLTHANCSSQFKFLCISLFYEFLMHCIVIFVCILLFCDYFMTSDVWGYFLDQYTIHYFPIK